jgi:hypothetical protein
VVTTTCLWPLASLKYFGSCCPMWLRGITLYVASIRTVNSVALARKRTILTKRPPHVGEVSANLASIITYEE